MAPKIELPTEKGNYRIVIRRLDQTQTITAYFNPGSLHWLDVDEDCPPIQKEIGYGRYIVPRNSVGQFEIIEILWKVP